MTISPTDRLRRIDALFDAALDVPTGEQVAFVHQATGDDVALRDEVLALLRAHHRSDGFVDHAADGVVALVADAPSLRNAASERSFGPYRVLRELGRGGMGVVYLAERDDGQYRRRVAVKVLRASADAEEPRRRFLAERQILASLSHPHIAQLLDGGIADGELPYLVMEHVDGMPITAYCDRHQLTVDARLRLFMDVCDAVQHAHQNLVLHRDLKPGNVLVTADGAVKLLDFGIAKLMNPDMGAMTQPVTRTAFRLMTPAYASPEQVRGDALTTASDVYALGLLLYELLVGTPAHRIDSDTPQAVHDAVCTREPERPSSIITNDATGTAIADARDTTPERLRRQLRGDLDLITLTALQKPERRRYQSPSELAADLKRYASGHPVEARADSAAYRLRKFAGRHRVALVAGVAIAVTLGFAANRERVLRQRAEQAARRAQETERFLVSVFDVADPLAATPVNGGEVTARELVDRGAARVDTVLSREPAVQAELRAVLGRVYMSLGLFDRAVPLLQRALAQRTSLDGAGTTSTASDMDRLGTALMRQDKYDDAEPLLRQALATRRAALGNANPATAESIDHLATLLEQRGTYAAAESLFTEEVRIRETLPDSGVEIANAIGNLAQVKYHRGAYASADTLYQRALEMTRRRLGAGHAVTGMAMQSLAMTQQALGHLDEAERLYRESLAIKRRTLGNVHPSVTISLNNLGGFLSRERGKLDEAEAMVREAIALDTQLFGPKHSYVAEGYINLGVILRMAGNFAGSSDALSRAVEIDSALLGEDHITLAFARQQLAQSRYLLGDSAGAIALSRRSLAVQRAQLDSTHINIITTSATLGRMLAESGHAPEAEPLLRRVLALLDSTRATQRPQYIASTRTLGDALLAQGRAADALPILERAHRMARAQFDSTNVRVADAQLAYGRALAATGRMDEARPLLRSANAILARNRRSNPGLAAKAAREVERVGAR